MELETAAPYTVSDERYSTALALVLDEHRRWVFGQGGRRLDLRFANLFAANLSDAHLIEAEFRGANLSGARLNHAQLRGADLSGADLSDAAMDS